jgi:hypothetical protein
MSAVEIAAIATGAGLLYCFLGGITFVLMPKDNDGFEYVGAAFWPLALPAVVGMRLARWMTAPKSTLPKATAREVRP